MSNSGLEDIFCVIVSIIMPQQFIREESSKRLEVS